MKPKKGKKAAAKPKKTFSFFKKPEKVVNINTEDYIKPKKDTGKKALSIILWGVLGFVFIRGAVSSLQPNPLDEMQRRTDLFIEEQTAQTNLALEIESFAQNFAKEYLTYQVGRREDYAKRVKPYVSSHVSISENQNFKGNATATYLQAYKLQQYDKNQYDVYVMADIEYSGTPLATNETVPAQLERENTYLKIPVRVLDRGKYIVEDYPAFVAAPDANDYTATQFNARDVDKTVNAQIEQILKNFFAAYYQGNQTQIDVFLAVNADKAAFKGLDGRYRFKEIRSLRSFADPANPSRMLSLVELIIEDRNGQQLTQRFNVLVNHDGDRFYVVEMDTKTVDIKYNFSVQ